MSDLELWSAGVPGRAHPAKKGDRRYTVTVPLEDGRSLKLHLSEAGFQLLRGFLLRLELDDAAAAAAERLT